MFGHRIALMVGTSVPVAIVAFAAGLCAASQSRELVAKLEWLSSIPAFLVLYGQPCPHCKKRTGDRMVCIGAAHGTRNGDMQQFDTLVAVELNDRKMPKDICEDANAALDRSGKQTTQVILSKNGFLDYLKQQP